MPQFIIFIFIYLSLYIYIYLYTFIGTGCEQHLPGSASLVSAHRNIGLGSSTTCKRFNVIVCRCVCNIIYMTTWRRHPGAPPASRRPNNNHYYPLSYVGYLAVVVSTAPGNNNTNRRGRRAVFFFSLLPISRVSLRTPLPRKSRYLFIFKARSCGKWVAVMLLWNATCSVETFSKGKGSLNYILYVARTAVSADVLASLHQALTTDFKYSCGCISFSL